MTDLSVIITDYKVSGPDKDGRGYVSFKVRPPAPAVPKLRILKANTKSAHYRRFDLALCRSVDIYGINRYIKKLRASNLAKETV